ncbi:MAG TPA: BglII/BstYI family type II restriction endonuclease [Puia sp.]|jgi:hypothetical protein|nr:BglII/BstYI family type II restriction endonuclease [Puia sp.]
MSYEPYIPEDIRHLYEIHNFRNAAQILRTGAPAEFEELLNGFRNFRLTVDDIRKPGGNESDIPKKISILLRKFGWLETRIKGDLCITKTSNQASKKDDEDNEEDETETLEKIEELKKKGENVEQIVLKNFLDGHKVDYVKNRVAFDLEWNSKDQTFDRDLYAFRAFYECDLIDAAVLMTRSETLNDVFNELGPELDENGEVVYRKSGKPKLIKEKYGASTTWMGKLIYRINAGRHGGCPVLVLGITPKLIEDWKK